MQNTIRKTIPHINHSVSEKEFTQIIPRTIFWSLKSLPLVITVVAILKFGTATI